MVRIFRNEAPNKMNVSFSSKDSFWAIKNVVNSFASQYDSDNKINIVNIDNIDQMIEKLLELKSELVQVDLDVYALARTFLDKKNNLLELRNTLAGIDCGVKLIDGYELLPFQHVGVEFLCQVQRGMVADKVGLGKTLQGFCAAYKMIKVHKKAEKCFILVSSTIRKKWQNDIKKFLGIYAPILNGSPAKRIQDFNDFLSGDDIFLIISDDTFKRDFEQYIENTINMNFGIICDEIQRARNALTLRSKALRKLSNNKFCQFRFGLSATYIETGLQDLFGVMMIIDDSIFGHSYYHFSNRYLKLDYMGKVVDYNNVDEARDKMRYVAVRRSKEMVKDQLKARLPTVNMNTLWVELTKEQKLVYNEVLKRVVENIQIAAKAERISMATVLSEIMYLRQVCVSPQLIGHASKSSIKMDTLVEILPDIIDENKVVVFSHFVGFVDLLEEQLGKMKIPCLAMHGQREEGKANTRQEYIDKFQQSKELKVLITSDILKEGVDIPAASYVINVDILWNPAAMIQRAGRIDRLNQEAENIYVYNIWSENTIEQSMFDVIYEREELATKIIDEGKIEYRVKKLSFKDIRKMLPGL